MAVDPFFDHPRTRAATSLGDIELPVLLRELCATYAYFAVDADRATDLLAGTPLVPVRFATGSAMAGVAFVDFRDTSIGPYREVALVLVVVPRGARRPALPLLHFLRASVYPDIGFHILDLPVTTALSDAAGRELWGFPKFLTAIDIGSVQGRFSGVVHAPGAEGRIATLEGRLGPAVPLPALEPLFYSVRGGELVRTAVAARGSMRTGLGRGLTLRVGDATHPMAARLRALGLDGARPVAAQMGARLRLVLPAAVPVTAARAA